MLVVLLVVVVLAVVLVVVLVAVLVVVRVVLVSETCDGPSPARSAGERLVERG